MELHFQTPSGEFYTLNIQRQPNGDYIISIGEQTYHIIDVVKSHHNRLSFTANEQDVRLLAATEDGKRQFIKLGDMSVEFTKSALATSKAGSAPQGDLTAPMPGQIIALSVELGQTVAKGDSLVVLEAMKMENRIKAPYDGTVKALLCALGDTVERGQTLVELEPLPETD